MVQNWNNFNNSNYKKNNSIYHFFGLALMSGKIAIMMVLCWITWCGVIPHGKSRVALIMPSTYRGKCQKLSRFFFFFFFLHRIIYPGQPKCNSKLICDRVRISKKILIDHYNLKSDYFITHLKI